jgi:D-3-phosphoglycerate dehydrogenase
MPKVLITEHVHPDALSRLRQEPDFDVIDAGGDAALAREALPCADAIGVRILRIDAAMIEAATRLRVIAKHGVGTDNIDLTASSARGIIVLNTPDANKIAVAEHAMALMLALAKRLAIHDGALRAGDWRLRDALVAQELAGRRLAILGLGRSGQELARRAAAFDMSLVAWGRSIDVAIAGRLGVHVAAGLTEALASADFVSLHTPRVHASRPLIGASEIASMREGAFLINCARGGLIDEAALAQALRCKRLAGAGIDVFQDEPPSPDNPLLAADLDTLIVTPHIAGNTREASRRVGLEMADNIIAGLNGRPDASRIVRSPRA